METTPLEITLESVARFFGVLDAEGRRTALAGATLRHHVAGDTICREGEEGDELFIVIAGRVGVFAADFGVPRSVARLGRGCFFGEMAVLTNQRRSATVQALTEVHLLSIPRAVLLPLFEKHPPLRALVGRTGVRRTEQLFDRLSFSMAA